jgi:hypothetical protein
MPRHVLHDALSKIHKNSLLLYHNTPPWRPHPCSDCSSPSIFISQKTSGSKMSVTWCTWEYLTYTAENLLLHPASSFLWGVLEVVILSKHVILQLFATINNVWSKLTPQKQYTQVMLQPCFGHGGKNSPCLKHMTLYHRKTVKCTSVVSGTSLKKAITVHFFWCKWLT